MADETNGTQAANNNRGNLDLPVNIVLLFALHIQNKSYSRMHMCVLTKFRLASTDFFFFFFFYNFRWEVGKDKADLESGEVTNCRT